MVEHHFVQTIEQMRLQLFAKALAHQNADMSDRRKTEDDTIRQPSHDQLVDTAAWNRTGSSKADVDHMEADAMGTCDRD